MRYQDINAETIDRWIDEGWEWGVPVSPEACRRAREGDWQVLLTPNIPVPRSWFGDLGGKRVLGLASGGGQQMPILTLAGARCTVLDLSEKQIESEWQVARREGYDIEIVRGDMSQPLPFPDGTFDLIFHPVSNCYIREILPLWRECHRVLKTGGRLLAGQDIGMNFLVDDDESRIVNALPFDPLKNPEQMAMLERSDGGVQFSHSFSETLGGQLAAGFRLVDLYEDTNAAGYLHDLNVPCFIATLAVRE